MIVGVHSDGRSAGRIIFGCDYDCMVVAFKAYDLKVVVYGKGNKVIVVVETWIFNMGIVLGRESKYVLSQVAGTFLEAHYTGAAKLGIAGALARKGCVGIGFITHPHKLHI